MSERKVLSKYYPPDFDPRQLERRSSGKATGPRVQTVRLMAPFSMRCLTCGEYIYKGRKFNARKTTANETYLGIAIFRFFIRCTRCSAEISFRTDPQLHDYLCESGAKRTTESWRIGKEETETIEARLDRLEKEESESNDTKKATMEEVERQTLAAETQMAVADALDEVRAQNARRERLDRAETESSIYRPVDDDAAAAAMEEKQDAEDARRAFAMHAKKNAALREIREPSPSDLVPSHTNTGVWSKKQKKQVKLLPGLKGTKAPPAKSPLVDYSSDPE